MIVRKVILYIAMSLDGYITDQHGRIDCYMVTILQMKKQKVIIIY